jgi:hypothetical protein
MTRPTGRAGRQLMACSHMLHSLGQTVRSVFTQQESQA